MKTVYDLVFGRGAWGSGCSIAKINEITDAGRVKTRYRRRYLTAVQRLLASQPERKLTIDSPFGSVCEWCLDVGGRYYSTRPAIVSGYEFDWTCGLCHPSTAMHALTELVLDDGGD